MEVGLFGGTFNPIHLGHLRAAEEVCEALDLDKLIFVPAKLPPHKQGTDLGDAQERLDLVHVAVADNDRFEVSDLELHREGPSYSVDSIRQFIKAEPEARFWFIMGADQYREIHTWYNYRELFTIVDILVMSRPPYQERELPPQGIEEDFLAEEWGYIHKAGKSIRFLPVTPLDISSTRIREALEEGRSIRYLVSEPVRRLVEEKNREDNSE